MTFISSSGSFAMGFSGTGYIAAKGATVFLGIGGVAAKTTEAQAEFYMPIAATLSNFRVYVSANASNNNGNTCTVRNNGSDSSVTVSYDAAGTGLKADTTNTSTFSAGDRLAVKFVNAASGGGTKNITIEMVSFQLG